MYSELDSRGRALPIVRHAQGQPHIYTATANTVFEITAAQMGISGLKFTERHRFWVSCDHPIWIAAADTEPASEAEIKAAGCGVGPGGDIFRPFRGQATTSLWGLIMPAYLSSGTALVRVGRLA